MRNVAVRNRMSRLGLYSYCAEHDAVFEAGPEWTEPNATQLKNIACHPEIPYGVFKGDGEPDWVQNALGLYVMRYDGDDDYVDCGSASSLDIVNSLTCIAWIKMGTVLASQPRTYPTFLGKEISGFADRNYAVFLDRANDLCVFSGRNVAGDAYIFSASFTSSTYFDDLAWHMLSGVWDRTNTTAYVYIDTTEATKATGQTDGDLNTGGDLTLGWMANLASYFFKGDIGLPKIYNRALSLGEIRNKYEREKAMFGL